VTASDPSDNHETESRSARNHRRTAHRVGRMGAVTYVAGRRRISRASDSGLGGRQKLWPDYGHLANDSAHDLPLEATLSGTGHGGVGATPQRQTRPRGT